MRVCVCVYVWRSCGCYGGGRGVERSVRAARWARQSDVVLAVARENEVEVRDLIVCACSCGYVRFWTWRVFLAGSGRQRMMLGRRVGNK